jgi:hypothetical protein
LQGFRNRAGFFWPREYLGFVVLWFVFLHVLCLIVSVWESALLNEDEEEEEEEEKKSKSNDIFCFTNEYELYDYVFLLSSDLKMANQGK